MKSHKPDYLILFCLAFLVVFGLAALASASSNLGETKFGDSFFYLKNQLTHGFLIGLAGFLAGYFIYYRRYQKFAILLLLISVAALALVFTPLGFRAGGAERWVKFGLITFQPAELLKITVVLYLAAWLSAHKERSRDLKKGLAPFLVILGVIAGLLFRQPATTTVFIIITTAVILYFVSGARLAYVFGTIFVGVLALALVVMITPYRLERITNFLRPEAEPLAGGYHINQAMIAIGSGGFFGVGYGNSTTKISYLPEPIGDSIFAVIAEESGFMGSLALISVFVVLILRIMLMARKTQDKFGKLILVGFGSLIAIQTFINIASISGLIPLTGVPLPFISFGGTALVVFMAMGGIILNISKYS